MTSSISVALMQHAFAVGAIAENTQKICALLATEHSDIVLFPELTLTGYPPEDLVLRGDVERAVNQALVTIAAVAYPGIVIVGHPVWRDGQIFNAATVLKHGQVIGCYHKQALPNYGVFDEKRLFTAGVQTFTFDWQQQRFAVLICEDIWQTEPAAAAAAAGADWALVLNASPYEIGKIAQRHTLLTGRAGELNLGIVYVNQVMGQDELVFDGSSCVVDAQGQLQWQAPAFVADTYRLQLPAKSSQPVQPPHRWHDYAPLPVLSPEAEVYQALVLATRDYIERNGFPGAVLGLSGGIDSALTLAIAVDAIGADRVQALMLPFRYTSDMSVSDAAEQATRMGIQFDTVSIEPMFDVYMQQLQPLFAGKGVDTTEENLQARLRGVLLMALSNKTGRILLTTGNKSEVAVGYCTLYGDMCGGFAVIKDVPKTLVYRLASYRNSISPVIPQRVIDRPPSAELAPGQTDQDNLPPYDDLDAMIAAYVEQDLSLPEIVALGYDEAIVRRVLNLIDINEYKRRQSAIGPKITQRNFGKDRRYPITSALRKQR